MINENIVIRLRKTDRLDCLKKLGTLKETVRNCFVIFQESIHCAITRVYSQFVWKPTTHKVTRATYKRHAQKTYTCRQTTQRHACTQTSTSQQCAFASAGPLLWVCRTVKTSAQSPSSNL